MAESRESPPTTEATIPVSKDTDMADISDIEKLSKHSVLKTTAHIDTRSPSEQPIKKLNASSSPPASTFADDTEENMVKNSAR